MTMATFSALLPVGIFILLTLLLLLLEHFFYNRLQPRLAKTAQVWDEALLSSIHKPLQFFIIVMAASFIFSLTTNTLALRETAAPLHNILTALGLGRGISAPVRSFLLLLLLFWFGMRFIGRLEKAIIAKPPQKERKIPRDKTTVQAIAQLSRVIMIILVFLIGMQTLNIPITTLLTVGGIGGIAVGFAAKDTLSNFLGGMMIFWDRPFSVGDWVRSPDRQIEGTVEKIGWRLTVIRTFDKRPLYVPNGAFSTMALENPSRMSNRRIKTTIGLRYQDAPKMAVILKDIEDMLRHHPEIDTQQTLMVNLFEFSDSALNFFIYTFTKTTNWVRFQAIQQDVFLKAIDIITKHGAQCAFPTTSLDIPERYLQK